jgi:hypothetical protein
LTAAGRPRTLPTPERRLASDHLGAEAAVFAAMLIAMVPVLVLDALHRTLPTLSVVVAVPAGDAAAPGEIEAVLADAGIRREVTPADPARTARAWSALAAAGDAPQVVEAALWPAAAVDRAALEARLAEVAPAAAVDLRRRPPGPPTPTVAASLALAALAALAWWRLARAVRRRLRGEAATLSLARRFGADPAWCRAEVVRPLVRTARRGAAVGAVAGTAAGGVLAAVREPAVLEPGSGVAGVVAASTAVAVALTVGGMMRVVVVTAAGRLAAVASPRP